MMVEDEVLCRYGFAVAQNVSFRQILQMIQCVDEVPLLKISISTEIGGDSRLCSLSSLLKVPELT